MKKQKQVSPYEWEEKLIDWLIRWFDTLPHELKVKLAEALDMKLMKITGDEMLKRFQPEWDKQLDDLRKTGWK